MKRKKYVYLVISPTTGIIYGAFSSNKKALNFLDDEAFIVKKLEIL